MQKLNVNPINFSGRSPVFRYCELLPLIANARLFSKNDKATFNAPIVNHGVIQFGKLPFSLSDHLIYIRALLATKSFVFSHRLT